MFRQGARISALVRAGDLADQTIALDGESETPEAGQTIASMWRDGKTVEITTQDGDTYRFPTDRLLSVWIQVGEDADDGNHEGSE